jgi:hypothetical protein
LNLLHQPFHHLADTLGPFLINTVLHIIIKLILVVLHAVRLETSRRHRGEPADYQHKQTHHDEGYNTLNRAMAGQVHQEQLDHHNAQQSAEEYPADHSSKLELVIAEQGPDCRKDQAHDMPP